MVSSLALSLWLWLFGTSHCPVLRFSFSPDSSSGSHPQTMDKSCCSCLHNVCKSQPFLSSLTAKPLVLLDHLQRELLQPPPLWPPGYPHHSSPMQDAAAKIIFPACHSDQTTPSFDLPTGSSLLHCTWFKLLVLTSTALHNASPVRIPDLVLYHITHHPLCSTRNAMLSAHSSASAKPALCLVIPSTLGMPCPASSPSPHPVPTFPSRIPTRSQ